MSHSANTPSDVRHTDAGEPASSGWCVAAIALLGARWMMPAEAPELGSTLWLVAAWLAVATVWLWRCGRVNEPFYRWDRWDALICTLTGGFMLSSIHVLVEGGQRRAALTMFWEWLGIALAVLLCRRWFRGAAQRQALLVGLMSLTVALSALGAWQHHVWYPSIGRLVKEYESLSSRSNLSQSDRNRLRELQQELGPDIALLESSGRESFLNRVLNSTEPVGRFALANTFAAILAFGLIMLGWSLVSAWRSGFVACALVLLLIACVLLGYVMLLTKSRSAWLGLAAGGAYACCVVSIQCGPRRKSLLIALGACVTIAVLLVVTWLTGGLDRLVVAEATKSLSYRAEFWEATLGVIGEDPWLGTGPGNFRQHYLKHKLPGSSEEILDPHNLLLEAWAVGGILPVLSLITLLGGAAWSGVSQRRRPVELQRLDGRVAAWGVAFAGLVPFAYNGATTTNWDIMDLAISGGAMVFILIWNASPLGREAVRLDHPVALMAIFCALVVHLLASGGLGMPGVVQLLLLICVYIVDGPGRQSDRRPAAARDSRGIYSMATPVMLATLVALVMTGLIPVMNANALVHAGDVDSLQRGSATPLRSYTLATEADDWDPVPWNRRAEFYMHQWHTADRGKAELFEQVVSSQREAILRDPRNPRLKFELGEWHWMAYRDGGDESLLQAAIDWLEQGVAGYPNSSLFHATLSLALDASGETSSVKHAVLALELDDLNRAAGHSDKLLLDELRGELLRIAGESNSGTEGD